MATYGAHSPMVLLFILQNKDAIRQLAQMRYIGDYGSHRFALLKQKLVDKKEEFFASTNHFRGYGGLVSYLIAEEEEKLHDEAARNQDVLGGG